jgi:predicted nucleic acid-binding protein
MKRASRLFLDASVLIAASGSKTGASALILELCHARKTRAISSRFVLLEAERNIRAKLGQAALLRFYQSIASLELELVEAPTQHEIAQQEQIIDCKDAHVLAAAMKGDVGFLLTLDRKHFMSSKVLNAELPFQIMTPGDFLHRWLQQPE